MWVRSLSVVRAAWKSQRRVLSMGAGEASAMAAPVVGARAASCPELLHARRKRAGRVLAGLAGVAVRHPGTGPRTVFTLIALRVGAALASVAV